MEKRLEASQTVWPVHYNYTYILRTDWCTGAFVGPHIKTLRLTNEMRETLFFASVLFLQIWIPTHHQPIS